jgi:predicted O-linked N-acetylglucosamine transferase (SPINDLY family)
VRKTARKKVEFHFLINMIGLNLHQSSVEINEWLPGSKVYERTSYPDYVRHINECNLHACTFPFGGVNSNIDSFKVGVPIVCLWGDEPHSRYDGIMIRRAGLPEWLIAKSINEYVSTMVRLIDDDDTRNALRDQLLHTDIDGLFFGDPPAGMDTAVADAFWKMFLFHEEMS